MTRDRHEPNLADIARAEEQEAGGDEVVVAPEGLPPLGKYNVIASIERADEGRKAVLHLERSGIEGDRLSYVELVPPDEVEHADAGDVRHTTEAGTTDPEGITGEVARTAGASAALGGGIGAGAMALIALALPGIGPAVGAGVLAAAIGGGAIGTVTGGIVGAFSKFGASDAWKASFEDLRDGHVLIGVHTQEKEEAARSAHLLEPYSKAVHVVDHHGRPVDVS